MKSETEQLLGTLEVILRNPSLTFIWETEEQGEFNVWNLAIAEGFVSLTDVDVAIAHWQAVEHWGTPTDQSKNDYEYAPPRNERKDGWNAEIEAKRFESYQQLSQILKAELQELQAFSLSVPAQTDYYFKFVHPDFCFYILIGKTEDGDWLCLSPTVHDVAPDLAEQVIYTRSKKSNSVLSEVTNIKELSDKTLALQSRIENILSDLPPIELYSYYHGGYKGIYAHKILYAFANQKIDAIEQALQSAGMLTVEKTNILYGSDELSQFFKAKLGACAIYRLSFWDIAYTYEIGQAPTGDCLGMRSLLEFEYNP